MEIQTVDYQSAYAKTAFPKSLKETGFAVLKNHPISFELIQEVYQEWEDFFKWESRLGYQFDPNVVPQAGYFPFQSENAKDSTVKDLKEFYHYYPSHKLPDWMSSKTANLFAQLQSVAYELLQWVEASLPEDTRSLLAMPLSEMAQGCDSTLLRILHYPPLTDKREEGAVRAAPHEDINLITLIPAATESGLQVKDRAGNWHGVSCESGTLVVNNGDMLQMATGGFYPSTTHRVVNPVGEAARKSRFSLPLFLHAREEVPLSKTQTAGEYLRERLREIGLFKDAEDEAQAAAEG